MRCRNKEWDEDRNKKEVMKNQRGKIHAKVYLISFEICLSEMAPEGMTGVLSTLKQPC
jgi:hypothetical protein